MLDAQSHKPLPKQNEIRTNESQGVVEIAINFSGLAENILQQEYLPEHFDISGQECC